MDQQASYNMNRRQVAYSLPRQYHDEQTTDYKTDSVKTFRIKCIVCIMASWSYVDRKQNNINRRLTSEGPEMRNSLITAPAITVCVTGSWFMVLPIIISQILSYGVETRRENMSYEMCLNAIHYHWSSKLRSWTSHFIQAAQFIQQRAAVVVEELVLSFLERRLNIPGFGCGRTRLVMCLSEGQPYAWSGIHVCYCIGKPRDFHIRKVSLVVASYACSPRLPYREMLKLAHLLCCPKR